MHNAVPARMKAKSQALWSLVLAELLVIVCLTSLTVASEQQQTGRITLNIAALEHAKMLINQERVVVDSKGAWTQHQPSVENENDFIRLHGFVDYAKWHLGIDESHAEDTKARYKFPYGDFTAVRRSALLAAKSRARQYGYSGIENAAVQLLQRIHSGENEPPRHHSFSGNP
jgi:hypothetical protein